MTKKEITYIQQEMRQQNISEASIVYLSRYAGEKIGRSQDVAELLMNNWEKDINFRETMYLILMNRRNVPIGKFMISKGGIHGTVIDVKLINCIAILSLSSSVILCHNHPSGEANPSEADIKLTKKVKDALKLFDINLLDHLIVVPGGKYYSFADNGLI